MYNIYIYNNMFTINIRLEAYQGDNKCNDKR